MFGRHRKEPVSVEPAAPTPAAAWLNGTLEVPDQPCPATPADQVELVCKTVEKLSQLQKMVKALPELPVGDRQELLDRLATTTECLSALYFLDAIY